MHGIDTPIVAVIGALVLTGCGASTSKGPPLTHEQFVDRMHSICRPINNMNGKFGDPSFDKPLIDEARHELSQLRSLNPPQAEADALHDAFDHWSSALDDFERLTRAFETDDPAAAEKAFRDAASEARVIARLIPGYPVGECLGQGIG